MANKFIYIVGAAIALTSFMGCSVTETNPGKETAADIEAARMEGRMCARRIITRQWHDTAELRRQVEKERLVKAHYDSIGHKRSAESFDSAFVSTIHTVNPVLGEFVKKL